MKRPTRRQIAEFEAAMEPEDEEQFYLTEEEKLREDAALLDRLAKQALRRIIEHRRKKVFDDLGLSENE